MAAPENTLEAFRLANLVDSDLVELDYFHSSDGVPVVFHDPTLDRTTNAGQLWGGENHHIAERSLEELKELDAGNWFSSQFAGAEIPTLEEALNIIQENAITLIERKEGDARTLIELLRRMEYLDDVHIQSFDWEFLADCRELALDVPLGALGPPRREDGSRYPYEERFLDKAFLHRIESTGANVVGWNRQVTRESVREAQSRGFKVWIYTINDLDTALELLAMGVDGIISENPPIVWKALALRSGGWEQ